MEELIPLPLPEAHEIFYPEPDWPRRFFNEFDWFRAQEHATKVAALEQWHRQGKAHILEPVNTELADRCETWYCEPGKFFVRLHRLYGLIKSCNTTFQSASCLKMYGNKLLKPPMLNGKPIPPEPE